MLASLILASIFARQDLAHTRSDVVSSLLYYANWHQIIANHSYFNLMGNPSLLQHTWSLGVEEQFYLLWPAAFLFLSRRGTRAVIIGTTSAAVIVIVSGPPSAVELLLGEWVEVANRSGTRRFAVCRKPDV